jgi:hypothetical protein
MLALKQFDATEANLIKIERLRDELFVVIPPAIESCQNVEYKDRTRSSDLLLASLSKIKGWKPKTSPPNLGDLAQNRIDAIEVGEARGAVFRRVVDRTTGRGRRPPSVTKRGISTAACGSAQPCRWRRVSTRMCRLVSGLRTAASARASCRPSTKPFGSSAL